MDALIIFCAKYLIVVSVIIAVVYVAVAPKRQRFTLFLIASVVSSWVVGKLLGFVWYDPLPFVVDHTKPLFDHVADNGFPSDHMLIATALATAVFFYNRRLGVLLGILALLIGISRVLAGVHHIVDVVAAALVAIGVVYIVRRLFFR